MVYLINPGHAVDEFARAVTNSLNISILLN
jgi:hypothetical protein